MSHVLTGLDRQREIYLAGVAGQTPKVPLSPEGLATAARNRLSKEAYAYIAGGSGQELTMRSNREAFAQWELVPRMLRNVAERDLSISLFGRTLPTPFLLSPIGVLEMAHPQADLAVGRAAAQLGVPYIFSNQASVPMEAVAAAMGAGPRWFQLYWSKSRELVKSLVQRAEGCGCEAIVVTLDTTLLGWRVRDLEAGYLPFLRGKGIAQYTSDPVFLELAQEPPTGPATQAKRKVTLKAIFALWQMAKAHPGSTWGNLRSGRALRAVQHFIQIYTNPALAWEDLSYLREVTKLPILLKGILHPDDARRAVEIGMDGVVVSNHGGRQVDGAVGALTMLPEVVAAVEGRIPVIFDSGIRTGADAVKALALGATAVGIGRPYVYGLALDGEAGVAQVLTNLMAELDLTLGLCGLRSVEELSESCLRPAQPNFSK